ncbi:hypothetical protein L596_002629 [Steinernema carpocapsae]|uniref:Aminopeptidase N-like N-terminal domain-containing protein n=1 Tax=Steinernema carpocapsae TaxID=34508 RepID=A0A4U8URM5_STECR|nr:hypothetical protein L596_002629 [Steinernema carpocapsae]
MDNWNLIPSASTSVCFPGRPCLTMTVCPVCPLVLVILCAPGVLSNYAFQKTDDYDHNYRLPKTFLPIVYDLKLTVTNEEDFTKGQATIEIQCQETTDEIMLSVNPNYVEITHSRLEDKLLNRSVNLGRPSLDFETFTARFALPYPIQKGYVNYLKIWFKGTYAFSDGGFIRKEHKAKQF